MKACQRNLDVQHLPWHSFAIRNQRMKQICVNTNTENGIFSTYEKYSACKKAYPPEETGINSTVTPQGVCWYQQIHLKAVSLDVPRHFPVIWASGIFSLKSCFQTSNPWILYNPLECLFWTLTLSLLMLVKDFCTTAINISLRVESKTAQLGWCKAVFVCEL